MYRTFFVGPCMDCSFQSAIQAAWPCNETAPWAIIISLKLKVTHVDASCETSVIGVWLLAKDSFNPLSVA